MQFLLFTIANRTLALELAYVERVVWAASLIQMPQSKSHEHAAGMINIYGIIMPVISMTSLVGLPEKTMELSDQFIICKVNENRIALWVERVLDVQEYDETDLQDAKQMFPDNPHVKSIIKDKENIIVVWNIEPLVEQCSSLCLAG